MSNITKLLSYKGTAPNFTGFQEIDLSTDNLVGYVKATHPGEANALVLSGNSGWSHYSTPNQPDLVLTSVGGGFFDWLEPEEQNPLDFSNFTGALSAVSETVQAVAELLDTSLNVLPVEFITATALNAALGAAPTLLELTTYIAAESIVNTLVYYTGTDNTNDTVLRVLYVTAHGIVLPLFGV